jgi:hypothetical protein
VIRRKLDAFLCRPGPDPQGGTDLEHFVGYDFGTSIKADDTVANLRSCYRDQTFRSPDALVGLQAPETVVEAPIGSNAKRGGLFLMVRVGTEADEAGPLATEGGEL